MAGWLGGEKKNPEKRRVFTDRAPVAYRKRTGVVWANDVFFLSRYFSVVVALKIFEYPRILPPKTPGRRSQLRQPVPEVGWKTLPRLRSTDGRIIGDNLRTSPVKSRAVWNEPPPSAFPAFIPTKYPPRPNYRPRITSMAVRIR